LVYRIVVSQDASFSGFIENGENSDCHRWLLDRKNNRKAYLLRTWTDPFNSILIIGV